MEEKTRRKSELKKSGGVFNCKYDEGFTLISADDSLFEFLGYTREEFQEHYHGHIMEAIYEEDQEGVKEEIKKQLACSRVFMYENRLRVRDGEIRWVWVSAELMDSEDEGGWFHCIFHDITGEKRAQQELALSELRYELVLAQTQDIIFELDCVTYDIYYSPNFERKFGYQIPTKGFPDSMFATDIIYEEDKAGLRAKFHTILNGENQMECEYRLKKSDGTYLWVDARAAALRDSDGRLLKILGIISDIDGRKQEILAAKKAAVLDPLTGIYNRGECVALVETYMKRTQGQAAMFLIDVDNFKCVNDTFGHVYGDQLLQEMAGGLRAVFRQSDVVARVGGDEFVVFMTDVGSKEIIVNKASAIQGVFERWAGEANECIMGCSIGVSFYPEHGSDFLTLYRKADEAMYRAKKSGKRRFCVYDGETEL